MGISAPLYHQIEMDLRKKIVTGGYRPGHLLPSERDLMDTYKVSRLTVREAVNRLAIQGLVIKKQGKGTYVPKFRPEHADHMVGPLNSSSEVFLLKNYTVNTIVLESKKMAPTKKIREELQLKVREDPQIFYLERVRYADKVPVAHIKCYLPYGQIEGIEKIDFSEATLYRTLEDYYRLELFEAYEVIEATGVDKKSAKLLELELGAPVLLNQRTTYLKDGTIIEYEKVRYRSDIYKYQNKLIRRGHAELTQVL